MKPRILGQFSKVLNFKNFVKISQITFGLNEIVKYIIQDGTLSHSKYFTFKNRQIADRWTIAIEVKLTVVSRHRLVQLADE